MLSPVISASESLKVWVPETRTLLSRCMVGLNYELLFDISFNDRTLPSFNFASCKTVGIFCLWCTLSNSFCSCRPTCNQYLFAIVSFQCRYVRERIGTSVVNLSYLCGSPLLELWGIFSWCSYPSHPDFCLHTYVSLLFFNPCVRVFFILCSFSEVTFLYHFQSLLYINGSKL